MAGLGAETRWLMFLESAFKTLWTTEKRFRFAATEEGIENDKGYEDPGEITGVRVASTQIAGREQNTGPIGITAGPENSFPQFFAALCGVYETHAGAFHREYSDSNSGTTFTVSNFPVTTDSELVFIRDNTALEQWNQWDKLTKVGAAPATGEYSINDATGEITTGDILNTKDILVLYCEDVAGVYSHYYTPGDVPSLGIWSTKGETDLFEWAGAAVNSGSMEAASEGFLGLSMDILAAKEYVASIDSTGHTFPTTAALPLDGKSPFQFKQAQVYIDFTASSKINAMTLDIANNLDPDWTLNCDSGMNKIYPTTQNVDIGISTVFDEIKFYRRFKNEVFFPLELWYGNCANGTEIGSTGVNYQFYFFAPKYRIDAAPLPISTDKVLIEGSGRANNAEGMGLPYIGVVINSQSDLFA